MNEFLKFWRVTLMAFLFFMVQTMGHAQTYRFTIPVNGYLELHLTDFDALFQGTNATSSGAYPNIAFQSMTETVTYDPIYNTLRQTGYITVSNPAPVGILTETRQINGQTVSGIVTVQQVVTNGVITFDSGVLSPESILGNPSRYYPHFNTPIQISGNYSLNTGGSNYVGIFDPQVFFNPNQFPMPFYNAVQNSNGSVLALFGNSVGGNVSSSSNYQSLSGSPRFGTNAANGFDISLLLGGQQTFDPFLVLSLDCSNTAMATLVSASNSPANFFTGQSFASTNVFFLQFSNSTIFGYYNLSDYPYIYHYDMGWVYFIDGSSGRAGDAYFYDFASGHFWFTSPTEFPYIYDFSLGAWLYYYPNPSDGRRYSSAPRDFYNFNSGRIITQ